MTVAEAPNPQLRRADFERWRRRSRLIRMLRILLPGLIVAIFVGLAASVAYSTFKAQPQQVAGRDEPIRLVTPRFVGRDDKGRPFVLTAESATRDRLDYQRVVLVKPALVLDEGGPDIALGLGEFRQSSVDVELGQRGGGLAELALAPLHGRDERVEDLDLEG